MTKKIYPELMGRVGIRARQLIDHPPEGYEFVSPRALATRVTSFAIHVDFLWLIRWKLLNPLIPVNLLAALLPRRRKMTERVVLVFSDGPPIFAREPWVGGVEVVTQFADYHMGHFRRFRKLIERSLVSPYCKKLICWSEAARRTVLRHLDSEKLAPKTEVVPVATYRKDFAKSYRDKEGVRILFVGSGVSPRNFEIKGGKEVLAAFLLLRKRYEGVELVVRSDVPAPIKRGFAGVPGLRIIDQSLPPAALEEEFRSADIFWYPAHSLTSIVVLEAMAYELPTVTTDYYDNPEIVADGETGLLIPHSSKLPPWEEYPLGFAQALRTTDAGMVEHLVKKTSLLIDSPELRRRLGAAARREVETGRFSLERKNRQLKRILDEATEPDGR